MIESQPHLPPASRESNKPASEKDSSSRKKKKLGRLTAKEVIVPPEQKVEPEKAQSLWQRLSALAEKKELDKALLRPVEQADNDTKLAMPTSDTPEKDTAHQGNKEVEDLVDLTEEETTEAVKQYSLNRQNILKERIQDAAEPPIETAADIAFLEFVEKQLQEREAAPIEKILDVAEKATVQLFEEKLNDDQHESVSNVTDTHLAGEITLRNSDENDSGDEAVVDLRSSTPAQPNPAASTSGSSGGNGGVPPVTPQPPQSGSAGSGNIPPQPPVPPVVGGGAGNVPPPPGSWHGGMPAYGGGNHGVPIGTSPNAVALSNGYNAYADHELERRAIARGLLLGGIIGYLIGRRRGRIKTEKRLLPIQKKLEKQVIGLQSLIFEREQKIQLLAQEKSQRLKAEDKRILAERLAGKQGERQAYLTKQISSVEHAKRDQPPSNVPKQRSTAEAGLTVSAAKADFERKVAALTTTELKTAAEKIRLDTEDVSLKELWDTNRLDEKAVKRVVAAYIGGESVRYALNRELFAHDRHFDVDPQLRNQKSIGSQVLQQRTSGGSDWGGDAYDQDKKGSENQQTSLSSVSGNVKDTLSVNSPKTLIVVGGTVAAILALLFMIF